MDEAERRCELLATSVYLEGRSHALIVHSQELIARAQRIRAHNERIWRWQSALSTGGGLGLIAHLSQADRSRDY